jgi:hypothetical protein
LLLLLGRLSYNVLYETKVSSGGIASSIEEGKQQFSRNRKIYGTITNTIKNNDKLIPKERNTRSIGPGHVHITIQRHPIATNTTVNTKSTAINAANKGYFLQSFIFC